MQCRGRKFAEGVQHRKRNKCYALQHKDANDSFPHHLLSAACAAARRATPLWKALMRALMKLCSAAAGARLHRFEGNWSETRL